MPSRLFFFYLDRLDVIYTGPDRSFIAPSRLIFSGLLQRLIENILKEALLIMPPLGFAAFSNLSPRLVIMTLQLLFVPSSSSSYLDASGGTYLIVVGSQGCMTLRLPRTNQMWNEGPTELQVTEGYWTAVGAKLLPIVGETFLFDFPQTALIVRTNFVRLIYGASATQCEPAKRAIRQWWVGRLSDD